MDACRKILSVSGEDDVAYENTKDANTSSVAVNTTSIVCKAPIRDDRPRLIRMASAFVAVTSVVVALRIYQRLVLGSGLCTDDYLIIVSYVSERIIEPRMLCCQVLTRMLCPSALRNTQHRHTHRWA